MKLLVFAHFSESRTFLEKGNYNAVPLPFEGLWQGEKDFILVGGEGSESACRAAYILGKFPQIQALYNIGIAAGLSSRVSLENIYSIRTCYRCQGEKNIAFHSFSSADSSAKIDLISSDLRITTSEQSNFLESFAPLADREAHPLARAAQRVGIPFYAFKLVSDIPSDSSSSFNCQTIRQKSHIYSRALYDFYKDHRISTRPPNTIPVLPDNFYLTVTMKRHYHNLKNSLAPSHLEKIICRLQQAPLSPKERGKALLKRLKKISFPIETERALKQIFSPLQGSQRRVFYGRTLESPKFQLQAGINAPEDIEDLIAALEKFDYSRFQKLFVDHV